MQLKPREANCNQDLILMCYYYLNFQQIQQIRGGADYNEVPIF